MGYSYILRVARKPRPCSRCRRRIKQGEVYIYHHGYGMGTAYRHDVYYLCVCCGLEVAERMLKHGVKMMVGVTGDYPAKDKPLGGLAEKLREALAACKG